jgi:hypothetical protein
MMHSANERAPSLFFCYVLIRTSLHTHTHFFVFFLQAPLARRARKQKERATSPSLSLFFFFHTHATKVISSFFFDESDKPDRKSLRQAMDGVIEQEKRGELILYAIEQQNKNTMHVCQENMMKCERENGFKKYGFFFLGRV